MISKHKDAIEDPHTYLSKLKKQSNSVIFGFLDPVVPVELIHSFGISPTRLVLRSETSGSAESYLPHYVCEYTRNLLSQALDGSYDYLDGLVISVNHCDTLRLLADIWHQKLSHRIFSFYLPLKQDGTALEYTINELKSLITQVEKYTKKSFSLKSFITSIRLYETTRDLLQQLRDLRLKNPDNLPFSSYNDLIMLSDIIPRERFNKELQTLLQEYEDKGQTHHYTNRLLVMGGMVEDSQLFRWMEEAGANIIWSELPFGTRYAQTGINLENQPLLSYCKMLHQRKPDAIINDRPLRIQRILDVIKDYKINGIIYLQQKFCDPYAFEYALIKPILEKTGISHLNVEITSQTHSKGQIMTRIQAFIEMIDSSYISTINRRG